MNSYIYPVKSRSGVGLYNAITLSAAADSLVVILDDSENQGCNEESVVCRPCS
jgi:hypothetical protein